MFAAVWINLIVFGAIALIVYVVVSRRHAERMELIRQGINPLKPAVATPSTGSRSMLFGLIFIALGLSGIIYFIVMGEIDDPENLFFAIAGLVTGGAMIFYYWYTTPQRKKALELYEKQLATGKFGESAPEEKTEPEK
ncbi:MAG TPA: hypothetical protein VM123_09905 [archaeon]|nr:hypothetical protein [archaeon]